ncbi:hypothetical protein ACIA5C_08130 [Actinoplanes sp. NPDC051343]|uniref:hypothetical protein n=1 Tax=Actinoplanes sp. NPDC051343 TaxID=3363906 RepID=UPI00379855FB
MRGKLAVLGVAVVATLSGCSAVTASATATPTTAPKATASPTPMRVIAVATPKAHTGAPGLGTTGSNWQSIVKSLTGYGQWLLGNPDPSMTGNVAMPGCGMSGRLGQQVSGLLNSNTYVQAVAPVITQVVGPSAPAGNTVGLIVVAGRAAEPVLGQKKGTVITTIAPYAPTTLSVTLTKGSDSKWRLCEVTGPDGAPAPLL